MVLRGACSRQWRARAACRQQQTSRQKRAAERAAQRAETETGPPDVRSEDAHAISPGAFEARWCPGPAAGMRAAVGQSRPTAWLGRSREPFVLSGGSIVLLSPDHRRRPTITPVTVP